MSVELSDFIADGMSDCCSAAVDDPSGENNYGRCMDCHEMCEIITDEKFKQMCRDENEHMKHTFVDEGKTLCWNCEGEA